MEVNSDICTVEMRETSYEISLSLEELYEAVMEYATKRYHVLKRVDVKAYPTFEYDCSNKEAGDLVGGATVHAVEKGLRTVSNRMCLPKEII